MSFPLSRLLAATLMCAACLTAARGIQLGDTEDQVLAELGKPTARVASGGAVRLTFPRGTAEEEKADVKAAEKKLTKLEEKKAKADIAAEAEAKKIQAQEMINQLLTNGMSADEILEKLK